eukprot:CAMPEP_0185769228 /NCGR_PEP_ID=MMETSP1174-20130828/53456_1 /TAXON_ID=35687 /ORGANISM="Dictyocha speculum, Strain CCMP1381" /LENGTH=373 /DNA_ID=CAMNT_0028454217 /DNA_START=20 /DNA_END=1141 /DNA_ORIENTATION=+
MSQGISPTPKRERSDSSAGQKVLTLLVPRTLVSMVIGKQGVVVKEIQSQCSVRVKIEQDAIFMNGEETKRVDITSESMDANTAAQKMILGICVDASSPTSTLRMLVPDNYCSMIIGKRGACINQIMATSNARINISKIEEMPPQMAGSERMITLTGTSDEVTIAQELLSKKTSELGGRSDIPTNGSYNRSMPKRVMGSPMGAMGSQMGGMGGMGSMGPQGSIHGQPMGQQMPTPSTMFAQPPNYPHPGAIASSFSPKPPSSSFPMRSDESRSVKVTFFIPVTEVGRAIGKSGSTIKEVIAACEHQVKIQVEKDNDLATSEKLGTAMRPIFLEGPMHLVHKAQALLLTKMHSQEPEATVTVIYQKTPAPLVSLS